MTKISDKIRNDDQHFESMIASFVTGQTKFDSMPDKTIALGKNLLVREIFRVFERAVTTHFEKTTKAKVETFLNAIFKKNIPLFLIMMLTEDKNLMESMMNVQSLLVQSLTTGDKATDKDKKFVKCFYEFLNPFNADASIKPLMKYLLKIQKGASVNIEVLEDMTKKEEPPKEEEKKEEKPK